MSSVAEAHATFIALRAFAAGLVGETVAQAESAWNASAYADDHSLTFRDVTQPEEGGTPESDVTLNNGWAHPELDTDENADWYVRRFYFDSPDSMCGVPVTGYSLNALCGSSYAGGSIPLDTSRVVLFQECPPEDPILVQWSFDTDNEDDDDQGYFWTKAVNSSCWDDGSGGCCATFLHSSSRSSAIPATPGVTYSVSADIRDDWGLVDVGNVKLRMSFLNTAGGTIANHDSAATTAKNTWEERTISATAPAGTTDVRLENIGAHGRIDNVVLRHDAES